MAGVRQTVSGVVQTEAGVAQTVDVVTTLVDSWEDQNISEYSGTTTEWDTVDPSTLGTSWSAPDGSYVVRNPSGQGFSRIISASTNALPNYFPKGNIARVYTRANALSGRLGAIFGSSDSNPFQDYYAAFVDYGAGDVHLDKLSGGTRSTLATDTGASPSADATGYLEITWDDGTLGGSNNDISVEYVEGGSVNGSIPPTNDTTHASHSGVGLEANANSSADHYADWYHLRS